MVCAVGQGSLLSFCGIAQAEISSRSRKNQILFVLRRLPACQRSIEPPKGVSLKGSQRQAKDTYRKIRSERAMFANIRKANLFDMYLVLLVVLFVVSAAGVHCVRFRKVFDAIVDQRLVCITQSVAPEDQSKSWYRAYLIRTVRITRNKARRDVPRDLLPCWPREGTVTLSSTIPARL